MSLLLDALQRASQERAKLQTPQIEATAEVVPVQEVVPEPAVPDLAPEVVKTFVAPALSRSESRGVRKHYQPASAARPGQWSVTKLVVVWGALFLAAGGLYLANGAAARTAGRPQPSHGANLPDVVRSVQGNANNAVVTIVVEDRAAPDVTPTRMPTK
jgi:hypothetical protein